VTSTSPRRRPPRRSRAPWSGGRPTAYRPNPGAWLTTTAVRKAIDRIRRENKRDDQHKEAQMVYNTTPPEPLGAIEDDRLRLARGNPHAPSVHLRRVRSAPDIS
jgi:predicted RNA polymerase sigma factor